MSDTSAAVDMGAGPAQAAGGLAPDAAEASRPVKETWPFSPFEWMLASRYLRGRRRKSGVSVIAGFSFLGILLGVGTLIVVMAVMNGFRNELYRKILGLNGHVIVFKQSGAGPFNDFDAVVGRLTAVPGVTGVVPLVEGQVLFSSPVQALGGFVRGMTEQGLNAIPMVAKNIQEGSIAGFDSQDGIAVGERLASVLGLRLGDNLTLISPRGAQTPFGTSPRTKSYRITALFEVGMAEYDKTYVFMPLKEAQKFFSRGDEVDVLEAFIDDPERVETRQTAMRAAAGPGFAFNNWRQRNTSFFSVLEVERSVMFIILSLIVLVATFNVISGLLMLVKDKGRDIAILRTMGATKGAIMRVFLITGASIGVVGTLAGLIAGLIFCRNIESVRQLVSWMSGRVIFDPNIYYLTRLPVAVDPYETAGIVLLAIALAILATLYPSYRASRLDPVEALRYE